MIDGIEDWTGHTPKDFLFHTETDVLSMFKAIETELKTCERWKLLHRESVREIVENVLGRIEHQWGQNHNDVVTSTWLQIVPTVLDDRVRGVKVWKLTEVASWL